MNYLTVLKFRAKVYFLRKLARHFDGFGWFIPILWPISSVNDKKEQFLFQNN
jgi:hypothetical protein